MSVISATNTMLERLGFSDTAAAYMMRDCAIDSLEKTACLDGEDDDNQSSEEREGTSNHSNYALTHHNNKKKKRKS
jgi:hypothetical protein